MARTTSTLTALVALAGPSFAQHGPGSGAGAGMRPMAR
jgi:hypothetical protein